MQNDESHMYIFLQTKTSQNIKENKGLLAYFFLLFLGNSLIYLE